MDEASSLDALSTILTSLESDPYSLSSHAQNIRLAQHPAMAEHLPSALEMLSLFWAAGDWAWLQVVEAKIQGDVGSLLTTNEILSLFERAEEEYLSIPLLQRHLEFLLERYSHLKENATRAGEFGEMFTESWMRDEMDRLVSKGLGHISESHTIWDMQMEWELERLSEASDDEKAALIERINSKFLQRLKQPHANNENTFQLYSSFNTTHFPSAEYESRMVTASKIKAAAVKAWGRRENMELGLKQSGYSLEAYSYYIQAELNPRPPYRGRAKPPKAEKPDQFVLSGLFERAISEAEKQRWLACGGSVSASPTSDVEPNLDARKRAEEALRSFWISYADFCRGQNVEREKRVRLLRRAVRSDPGSGGVVARLGRLLEELQDGSVASLYQTALGSYHPSLTASIEDLIEVYVARAGYEKRKAERLQAGEELWQGEEGASINEEESVWENVIGVLLEGIQRVRQADKKGDLGLRLERFFSSLCLEVTNMPEQALVMWEDAAKFYKTRWDVWVEFINVSVKQGLHVQARSSFRDLTPKNLDHPEGLWAAYLAFESLHGSVEDMEEAVGRIGTAREKAWNKRAREVEREMQAAAQLAAEQQASVPVSEAPVPSTELPPVAPKADEMQVDPPATEHNMQSQAVSESGIKRKHDDSESYTEDVEGSKRAKVDSRLPPKRDRENSTVFVGNLPPNTSESDLTSLFKDCGEIREVKLTQLPNSLVATVEFADRDSVLAALTKDKKRLPHHSGDNMVDDTDEYSEINVHRAWESTLYVTNFPEGWDDAAVRDLFGKYGELFDVRWPSKKFKSTRRFCYVQYTSPVSAHQALALHRTPFPPNSQPLQVFISNPERKKERTDERADDREVYIAGLSRFVNKSDLEGVFKTYGKVKDVRMGLDENGKPKGYAFIEFENEDDARKALAANNHEMKNRRIAVTMADSRVSKKTREGTPNSRLEARDRSVRIKNLPPNTQEGLLQQALEKLDVAKVKRVEIFEEKREAVVELENAAEAGKLLLHPHSIVFNGASLQLSEESLHAAPNRSTASGPSGRYGGSANSNRSSGRSNAPAAKGAGAQGSAPAAPSVFVPRVASRPRAGLGSKRAKGSTVISATVTTVPPVTTLGTAGAGEKGQAKGQDDFRKMLGGI